MKINLLLAVSAIAMAAAACTQVTPIIDDHVYTLGKGEAPATSLRPKARPAAYCTQVPNTNILTGECGNADLDRRYGVVDSVDPSVAGPDAPTGEFGGGGSGSGTGGGSGGSDSGDGPSTDGNDGGDSDGGKGGPGGGTGGSGDGKGNNGHGNGDQDAPGKSGDNNNAENSGNSGQGNSGQGHGGHGDKG